MNPSLNTFLKDFDTLLEVLGDKFRIKKQIILN